jgi:type I restriction enzyme R subunit
MNEAETRAEHMDPALKGAGWAVVQRSKVLGSTRLRSGGWKGRGRRGKALCADYVLVYRNRKVAVVETEAWDEEPTLDVDRRRTTQG